MGLGFVGGTAHNQWDPADKPYLVGGVAIVAVTMALFAVLLGTAAIDVWSSIIVFLLIIAVSAPLLRRVARAEGDPSLFKLFYTALVVKLLSSLIRYFVIFVVYAGNGDAGVYHEAGTVFARRFRDSIPIHPLPVISSFPVESHWIADITGVLYIFTGPSSYSGFFFFSYLCFWGQVLIVRGLKSAVPEADYRRFAMLVLFLPSLLFWPSSIGKEALMIACIGLVTYGGALLLSPKPRLVGLVHFGAGLVVLSFVRPHIAYMSVGALGVAMAVGSLAAPRSGISGRGRAVRLAALVGILLAASFASTRMASRFADTEEDGGSASTQATLDATLAQTSVGGSEFQPLTITGPQHVPLGVPSVLFRPLPWEARSVNSLIAASEGLLLLGLFATSWRRLIAFPKLALRRPFLIFAAAFILVFSMGFSFVGNFGILARQRTQVMPMVLMLLAIPASMPRPAGSAAARGGSEDETDNVEGRDGLPDRAVAGVET